MMVQIHTLTLLLCLSLSNAFVVSRPSRAEPSLFADNNQANYGADRAYPDSYVRCGNCEAVYAITEEDLGERGNGRRLECSVCNHSWFQSKDRIIKLNDDLEFIPLPQRDIDRINKNMEENKPLRFTGQMKLYVGNVAFECHEEDFFKVFGKIGEVGDVSLVRDNEGKNRGFGFVTMREKEAGLQAIDELDGMTIRGRRIAVRESNN